jgi:sugar/nucleoside kinase (ribokinase family)
MKSIACSPGAAPTIDPAQITPNLIQSASQVFVDGQTIRNREAFDRIERLCRELAVPLAVDVASADIARGECAAIARVLSESGATVFLNEDEAFALAAALEPTIPSGGKRRDAEKTADAVFSFYARSGAGTATIIMKRGERGARCWTAAGREESATEAVGHPVDDTGAGDVFAGAFLAARLAGFPTARSLEAANEAARTCLSVPGTRLDPEAFAALKARFYQARNNP